LDAEVQAMPERLRTAFVLCCLEGTSQAEAAERLGWKVGTVSARVTQARQELLRRLEKRGVSLSAALCAAALSREAASTAVPPALANSTLRAVLAGAGAARVAALAKGVTAAMFSTRTSVAAVLAAAGLLAAGFALAARGPAAAP